MLDFHKCQLGVSESANVHGDNKSCKNISKLATKWTHLVSYRVAVK